MPAPRARFSGSHVDQPSCNLPAPSDHAQIALLSAYESQALSSVTIGSQDVTVGTGTITIAPGSRPLYIVISSFKPVIWRFRGATDRVEHAVLTSERNASRGIDPDRPALAGAIGLPASRLSFPPRPGCLHYFSEAPSVAAAMVSGRIRAETGRMPEIVSAKYAVSGFKLPSGEIETTSPGSRGIFRPLSALVSRNFMALSSNGKYLDFDTSRYYPGGVIAIDPKNVIASATPAPYIVLPNQAGLAQLVKQGALEYHGTDYMIRRKMRFPAELTGAHAVNFLLRKGVPMPDGDPGHSCVVSEETGEVLANPELCRLR